MPVEVILGPRGFVSMRPHITVKRWAYGHDLVGDVMFG